MDGRPLVLGGVAIAHPRGLEGHSDGDCLLHALCDALLGAIGAGDMGRLFPSTDARWKGAASLTFLEEVGRKVAAAGYVVGNVDSTLIAQEPRLAPYLEAMRSGIAKALGVAVDQVSVKAKSTDGLDAMGRGEGIAAQAAVIVVPRAS